MGAFPYTLLINDVPSAYMAGGMFIITVEKLPDKDKNPETILNLPDDGSTLTDILTAPEKDNAELSVSDNAVREIEQALSAETDNAEDTTKERPFILTMGNVSDVEIEMFRRYQDVVQTAYPDLVEKAEIDGWTIILTEESLDNLIFNGTTGDMGNRCGISNEGLVDWRYKLW